MNVIPLSASSTSSTDNSAASTTDTFSKSLSQADFLKLLVAQMTAQDPLNPQSNTDFAAQMAQFSALQTSQGTQAAITKLNSAQQLQQANDLIGRAVILQTSNGGQTQGTVSGVVMNGGAPNLVVNGSWYDLSQVIGITSGQSSTPTNSGSSTKAPPSAPITTN